jgi:hypothetical protein
MKSSPVATGRAEREPTIVAFVCGSKNPGKAEESKAIPEPGNLAGAEWPINLPRGRPARLVISERPDPRPTRPGVFL